MMVKTGEDFVVFDAKSGEEITRSVLTQIIFEQENKGQNLLPITFLRQLIRFYGDSMQNLVPTYLDFSIDSLTRDSDKLRGQMANAFGPSAFTAIEETVRRNTEMFEQAMRMFLPFSGGRGDLPARAGGRIVPSRSEGGRQGRRRVRHAQAPARRHAEEDRPTGRQGLNTRAIGRFCRQSCRCRCAPRGLPHSCLTAERPHLGEG